jgi:hypothetical protein
VAYIRLERKGSASFTWCNRFRSNLCESFLCPKKKYVPPNAPQRGAVGSDATAPKELLKDLKVVLPPSAYKRASENKIKYLWVGGIK